MTFRPLHPLPRPSAALQSAILSLLLFLVCLFLAQPVAAQETAEPSPQVTATDLDSLVKTLEDDQAREELVQQLKTLIEAERMAAGDGEEAPAPVAQRRMTCEDSRFWRQ